MECAVVALGAKRRGKPFCVAPCCPRTPGIHRIAVLDYGIVTINQSCPAHIRSLSSRPFHDRTAPYSDILCYWAAQCSTMLHLMKYFPSTRIIEWALPWPQTRRFNKCVGKGTTIVFLRSTVSASDIRKTSKAQQSTCSIGRKQHIPSATTQIVVLSLCCCLFVGEVRNKIMPCCYRRGRFFEHVRVPRC